MNDLMVINDLATKQNEMDKFLLWADVKPQTQKNYIRAVNIWLRYLNDNKIESPTEEDLKRFKKDLTEKYHKNLDGSLGKPYSYTTFNTYLIGIKALYKYLHKYYGVENIADDIKKDKQSMDHQKGSLTLEQARALLNSLESGNEEDARNTAIIKLMLLTGIRMCEVVRANVEDIQNKGNATILKIQGKGDTNKNKYVVLYDICLNAINDYLKYKPDAAAGTPLFTSLSHRNKNQRLNTRTIQKIITDAYRSCGIFSKDITSHSLRHTAITLAINNGATLIEAQQMAHHKNPQTTIIYFNNIRRLEDNAETKLNDLFSASAQNKK